MENLNKDVLILILEELREDRNSLYSCLLVNKTLCEIIVLILWKNPWKYVNNGKEEQLFNVITSHLSEESKIRLIGQGINLFNPYRRPLFNYISFCRNLSLCDLSHIIYTSNIKEYPSRMIVKEELLKLFINKNTKFTSLSIPEHFDDLIHLIPGADRCFSDLEYLYCNTSTNQNILEGLAKISKSIKRLKFEVAPSHYNFGIVNLIESQKKLSDVGCSGTKDESFCRAFEESLFKHVHNIQYLKIGWDPITKILSHLVNLISLEINPFYNSSWSNLENVSLPFLRILKTQNIPPKILANLIENTKGHLLEVSAQYTIYDHRVEKYDRESNNSFIRSIYKNCPNLKYFRLSVKNDDISELENLLINCKNLDGLILNSAPREDLEWGKLFNILTRLSPPNLYKFKFIFDVDVSLDTFKIFLENWRNRRPILLKIFCRMNYTLEHINLFNEYKREGVIKMFSGDTSEFFFDQFEWNFRINSPINGTIVFPINGSVVIPINELMV